MLLGFAFKEGKKQGILNLFLVHLISTVKSSNLCGNIPFANIGEFGPRIQIHSERNKEILCTQNMAVYEVTGRNQTYKITFSRAYCMTINR